MASFRIGVAAGALLGLVAVSGCIPAFSPLETAGIAPAEGDDWIALPLNEWLLGEEVSAELLAACLEDRCETPAALIKVDAQGARADALERAFADPAGLVRQLDAMDAADRAPERRRIATRTTARKARLGAWAGMVVRLERPDRPDRTVHGAIVGRRDAERFSAIVAIAAREDAARLNAESAADALLR
jgi:hypothetical protein